MLAANNFTYGLLTPALGYLMSCLGAFLGLRCAALALACSGASRARWLILGALSFGATGIWVMHFIAMLGYSIPGETIRYNVPVTLLSLVTAVVAVGIGLFAVGFGRGRRGWLPAGGIVAGVGVASVHYIDMAGMRMAAGMSASPALLALAALIAVAGATALLWAVPRLHGGWPTMGAALIAGAVVSGLHYTGMAGMHVHAAAMDAMGTGTSAGGATAEGFLLPLIIGISIIAFILTAVLALSPTAEEIRADAQLLDRIGRHRMENQPGWPLLASGWQGRARAETDLRRRCQEGPRRPG